MKVEKDYEELFKLFNKHKIRYCIIGSYALAFHAKPRYTKDIDVLIEPSEKNSRRIVRALKEFGFENLSLSEEDFRTRGKIIQLGYEPLRVDLMTSVEGCSFGRAWKNRIKGIFGSEGVYFIGLDELIEVKKRSSRLQDQADLVFLLEARRARNKK